MASLFTGYETFSNHGTEQGIVPRFYLQMIELAEATFDTERNLINKLERYFDKNIKDFTDFYDIFHEVIQIKEDYVAGLLSEKYYYIKDNGTFNHDRSKELILQKKIKDFFIIGRQLLNNFAKSQIIVDQKINLLDLLIVKESNFQKNKAQYLKITSGISYSILFDQIEKARNKFLTEFNKIRDDFEHNNFQVEKFLVTKTGNQIQIIEPLLSNTNVFIKIDTFSLALRYKSNIFN